MPRSIDVPLAALLRVRELHQRIDESATRLADALGERLRCARGCSGCCLDDLEVSRVEAAAIADAFGDVLTAPPAPVGACAMLDERGECRVYAARPYVCRTQGLPLRWIERSAADEIVEHRDICPLNDLPARSGEAAPLEAIPAASCWTLGRVEEALVAIDHLAPGDERGARVRLRDLFATPARDPQ